MNLQREPCVLVVDDEVDVRETLAEVVEMGGCSAILAANGVEALALLLQRRPCLVILDLLMPVMNGLELIAEIRSRAELSDLPLVISTSAPERAPTGIAVLKKPLSLEAVWECMRRSCECDQSVSANLRARS